MELRNLVASRSPSRLGVLASAALSLALGAFGCGGEDGPPPPPPLYVAGVWTIEEKVDQSSCERDQGRTRRYTITVVQDAGDVTVVTPEATFHGKADSRGCAWSGEHRSAELGGWTTVRQVRLDVVGNGATGTSSWDFRSVRGGTVDCSGSSVVTGSREDTDGRCPWPPSDLYATAISESAIRIGWSDNSSNELGFRIERGEGEAADPAEVATVGADTEAWTDAQLHSGKTYYYRVRAYNHDCSSEYSNMTSASTAVPSAPPESPSNLRAAIIDGTSVRLTWTDNSDNEQAFGVTKTDEAGKVTRWDVVADVTEYVDRNVQAGTSYTYSVRARNSAGSSDGSTSVQVEVPAPPCTLVAPSGLRLTVRSSTSIELRWTDECSCEAGYRVEQSVQGSTYSAVATLGASAEAYTSDGLEPDTVYSYRVRSFDVVGQSAWSEVRSGKTLPACEEPRAPSDLRAVRNALTALSLSWVDNSDNESGFKVERGTDSETYKVVATLPANSRGYTDTGLAPGTYWYRIFAFEAGCLSAYAGAVQVLIDNPAKTQVLRLGHTPWFIPPWVGGDKEFDGHGPAAALSAELFTINRNELWIRVGMIAMETIEDYSTASGARYFRLWADRNVGQISGVESGACAYGGYTDEDDDADWLLASPCESEAGKKPGLVEFFQVVGDTAGDEAGSETGVKVHLNPIMVRTKTWPEGQFVDVLPSSTPKFVPPWTDGDADFNGNGPRVDLSAELSVRNGNEIWVDVYMKARETRNDWTTAEGKRSFRVHVHSRNIAEIFSTKTSSASYLDEDHSPDRIVPQGGGPVESFFCDGDTSGDEAGSETGVIVNFEAVRIRES